MKKFKIIALFTLFVGALSLTSCNGDVEPLDPALAASITPPTATSIVGTYKLTAYNTSVPTDLNGDGAQSTNQMNETACFNNMKLILNANHTFTADSKGVEINATGTASECFTDPSYAGTWALNGSTLTLTYMDGTEQVVTNFTALGNTLKVTANDGDAVTASAGVYAYVTCNIEIVYTKQ